MKKTLLLITTFLLLFSSCSNNKNNNENSLKFNGNRTIKYIKKETFSADERFGKIEFGKRIDYQNETGILSLLKNLTDIDTVIYLEPFYEISFDKKGHIVETNIFDKYENLENKYIYRYNKQSQKENISKYYDKGKLSKSYNYNYNDDKTLNFIDILNRERKLQSKITHQYDNGNINEIITYNKHGKKEGTLKYFYKNKKIETQNFEINNKSNYRKKTKSYHIAYDYNKKELVSQVKLQNKKDESDIKFIQYFYNDKNDVSEIIIGHYEGVLNDIKDKSKTYKYKYDKDNNWTQKIVSIDNNPKYIITRKLEYY